MAAITKLSLVEVSPSIVAQLNEAAAISRVALARRRPAIGASVATNDSIVAMSGWIIPEPFAIPVTVTGTPSITIRRDAPFGTVSVVMIADTASNQWSGASAPCAAGNAATIFSTGSGSMITPVENGSTSRRRATQHRGDGAARGLRRRNAGGTRAGIGVAGVDDERADSPLAFEMLPADDDRRRAKAVLREYAGGDGTRVERGEKQIVALPPLDLRGGGAEPHARIPAAGPRGVAACNGRASVSAR